MNHSSTTRCVPELLAPAGDWDSLRAAVANGADAVYFGLSQFNARHRATNFTVEELPELMAYLHQHNVKGHAAVNTLIFSDELDEVSRHVQSLAKASVDAVIVQDLGLMGLIHRMMPHLTLHASTQTTQTQPLGISLLQSLGASRVILARELSIRDIQRIIEGSPVPVEVFVHGALCVAYSGQCLTSESLGGRSANRGQCAQACRLPYRLIVDGERRDLGDKQYLLSPQDLAAYDRIAQLADAGVSSFKIEGRLKSATYVAATVQAYRQAIDAWAANQPLNLSGQQKAALTQSFSRGFTHGFLDGVNHQTLVQGRFPKSRGQKIGQVIAVSPQGLVVKLQSPSMTLKPGDGVVLDEGHPEQDEQGGRLYEVIPAKRFGPLAVEIRFAYGSVNLSAIAEESLVWKTNDPALDRQLQQSFARDRIVKRVPLSARVIAQVGQPLSLTLRDEQTGATAIAVSDSPLQPAIKHPLTPEMLREQLDRLGQTPYELADVHWVKPNEAEQGLLANRSDEGPDFRAGVMVPKSLLNDLRRQAVEQLLACRQKAQAVSVVEPEAINTLKNQAKNAKVPDAWRIEPNAPARLTVLCRSIEQLRSVLTIDGPARPAWVYMDLEDIRQYPPAVELAKAAQLPIALATLRVIKPGEEGLLRQPADAAPDAMLVRSLAAVKFYRQEFPAMPLIGDYALNVANELTAGWLIQQGLVRLTPSYDLDWSQLSSMLSRTPAGLWEMVIHQHMPMFHMEHCVFAATLSSGKDHRDCGRPCEQHRVELDDRQEVAHPLLADAGCRNTLYNGRAQSAAEYLPKMMAMGLKRFRIELLRQSGDDAKRLIESHVDLLTGRDDGRSTWRQLRVLNQLGVTRGTLRQTTYS